MYFHARQRFFRFEISDVHDDVDYLYRRYLENEPVVDVEVSKHTRLRHIDAILKLFRYRLCGCEEKAELEAHAIRAARISTLPVYVLRELIDHLRQRRIVLPGYTFLQEFVSRALTFERKRVADVLVDKDQEAALDRLLTDHEGLHAITIIKHEPRDFSHRQLLGYSNIEGNW